LGLLWPQIPLEEKEKIMKKIRQTCIILISIILLTAFFVSGCGSKEASYLESADIDTEEIESTEVVSTPEQDGAPILIYICGEVNSPGVYELDGGSRITDAVDAAGGLTDKASREYWNLAEPLTDGEMLYFPTVEEAKERAEAVGESTSSAAEDDGLININTADLTELQKIPGVGESRAASIISYRQENGSFGSIEDIKNVSGIADGLFEKMKDYIKV
jgi:competence protein ComEA